MSKKQLHNRLDNLFAAIGDAAVQTSEQQSLLSISWTWKINHRKEYIQCGPEVYDCLGIGPGRFGGQPIFNFALATQSIPLLKKAFEEGIYPVSLDLYFQSSEGAFIPVRFTINGFSGDSDEPTGWNGFAEPIKTFTPTVVDELPLSPFQKNEASSLGSTTPVSHPRKKQTASLPKPIQPELTEKTAKSDSSIKTKQRPTSKVKASETTLSVPVDLHNQGKGLLEISTAAPGRSWSEDEILLVQEVANQLSQAIENAQLYAAVQQELSERTRAEQEILRRNKDLSTLNEIGQQFSRLSEKNDIYTTLADAVGKIIDISRVTIATLVDSGNTISFPVCLLNGMPVQQETTRITNDLYSFAVRHRTPMILKGDVASQLSELGVEIPPSVPGQIFTFPLVSGDHSHGVLIFEEDHPDKVITDIQFDLLSTIASQAAVALENASLFQEITSALAAIENRERYQANVAQAVATLSEFGVRGLPDVLRFLGIASVTQRVYFSRTAEDEQGAYWSVESVWTSEDASGFDYNRIQHMPVALYPNFASRLKDRGWFSANPNDLSPIEKEFFNQQNISSFLLLSVPGKNAVPGFIALEQSKPRQWQNEEIAVLQVAADALANTFVRQDLLEQLQATLDETENLYKISHSLALATDFTEMLSAVAGGMHIPTINRAFLVLFENGNTTGKKTLRVAANWHNNKGTPPPAVGDELDRDIFQSLLVTEKPVFLHDVYEGWLNPSIRDYMLEKRFRSIAVLPLWVARKQLGAVVLACEDQHHFSGKEMRTYPPLADQMATAVENTRLFSQTQEALAETEQYYRISSGIAQARDLQDLVELAVKEALPTNADRVAIIVINTSPTGEMINFEVAANQTRDGKNLWPYSQEPADVFPAIMHLENDPLVITDLQQSGLDPVSTHTLKRYQLTSGIFVPLRSAGKLQGLLVIGSDKPAAYSSEDIRTAAVTANGITIAMERTQLLRDAQQRAVELEAAAEIARDTASVLSLDDLLTRIVNLLRDRFNYYHTAIFLMNDEGTHAIIRQASGVGANAVVNSGQRILAGSRSIIGRVLKIGEAYAENDVAISDVFLPNPFIPETRSEVALPLKFGDRIIGAVDIQSKKLNAFHPAEVSVLQILADQIAVAIENAKAYELAQKAYEEMREVDRMKSQFLANMSHELRTPLNSIIGFSRVILKGIDGPVNDLQRQDLTSIYNSGQHLLGLINDVLDLSKIEAGKMELQFEEINLVDLINSVMSTAVGLVKDKPIRLEHKIYDNLPSLTADPTRIRQVILNFVSNAAKFTDEGTITVDAYETSSPEGKPEVMVTVTDTGGGIAEQDRGKLFQPFSQVDDSPTRKTGGTGLGLSICRSFIEMHGGRIGLLRSTVGEGSTFFFTLPVSQPEPEEGQPSHPEIPEGFKVILSIDDDLQVINLYERFLQRSGYHIIPLTDPKQAVQIARQFQPYAITLDVMMPEKDGWKVMHDLKNSPETRDIPVIFCSILEEEEKGFSLGAADYLVKPFLQEELVNAINRLAQNSSTQKLLVVDDSASDRRLIEKILNEAGTNEFTMAASGEEALEFLKLGLPDIIILDLFMPGMNGFELLEKLRTDPVFCTLPVVILTGADLSKEQQQQLAEFSQHMLNKSMLKEKDFLSNLESILNSLAH